MPLLLLCLAGILLIRLVALYFAKIDLVLDEAQYWTWSQDLAFGYYSKPPLIAWIIRAFTDVCGSGEACVRVASPVLYTLTSIVIFFIGRELYDARVGFWSAIVFDTLPGASYSTFLITTDVPLLLFWALTLYAWVMLLKRQSMGWAIALGVAGGFGLLAKYAMIYFLLCAALQAIFSREARSAVGGGRGIVAFIIALALIAPNLVWNAQMGFPTFHHTASVNADWKWPYVHPLMIVDYLVGQLGVFGPILFPVLLYTGWRAIRVRPESRIILLLCFSLPVVGLIAIQAMLSRAHGNWASVAYPAASILCTVVLLESAWRLFRLSLIIHLVAGALITVGPDFAPRISLFEQIKALSRVLGWRGIAGAVNEELAAGKYGSILVDTRELAAELLYYQRGKNVPPLYVWREGPVPNDHYEMTRPFTAASPEPVLYATLQRRCMPDIKGSFASAEELGSKTVPITGKAVRTLHFCRLQGYRGPGGTTAPKP